jgi:hypothetical protein
LGQAWEGWAELIWRLDERDMELYQVTYIDKYKRPSIEPKNKSTSAWYLEYKTRPPRFWEGLHSWIAINHVSQREIPVDRRIKLNAQYKSLSQAFFIWKE